ncbi:MAG: NADH-quinone oxidoreductase subunit J [Alphaproteobacteria bacterium]|nr:NADH-quinone oxidoreductase subunit J [Alphaproteobacteria bacterium]
MISSLFFYLFAFMTVAAGVAVITARNPVHAVLFLILAFFNASGLFILMGAEFLAMLLVVVYVGAVAVLFLFVVMMLDIDYADMREGFQRHLPIGGVVGLVLLVELVLIFSGPETTIQVAAVDTSRSNTALLGDVIYTDYIYLFQLAGLILLVAMIGAITLTMRHREGVKRQSIAMQNARTREDSVAVVSVESHVAPQAILPDADKDQKVLR